MAQPNESGAARGALTGRRIAVLATDGVEQVELVEPVRALEAAGADVDLRWRDTGHGLTYEEVGEAREWLSGVLPKLGT